MTSPNTSSDNQNGIWPGSRKFNSLVKRCASAVLRRNRAVGGRSSFTQDVESVMTLAAIEAQETYSRLRPDVGLKSYFGKAMINAGMRFCGEEKEWSDRIALHGFEMDYDRISPDDFADEEVPTVEDDIIRTADIRTRMSDLSGQGRAFALLWYDAPFDIARAPVDVSARCSEARKRGHFQRSPCVMTPKIVGEILCFSRQDFVDVLAEFRGALS